MYARNLAGIVCVAVFGGASLAVAAGAAKVHYPAKTELTYEALVCRAPEVGNSAAAIRHWVVTRGYDGISFAVDPGDPAKGSRRVCFDTGQRKVVTLLDDVNARIGHAPQAGVRGHRVTTTRQVGMADPAGTGSAGRNHTLAIARRVEGLEEGQIDQWSYADKWLGRLRPKDNPEIIEAGGLAQGFVAFAPSAKAGEAAHLFCYRPALSEKTDLGPLARYEGQTLSKVYRLHILPSGDVAVLAGNDEITVIQIYQSPIMDTACAQLQAVQDKAGKDRPKVVIRTVQSLYDYAENADRTFGSMMSASDGRFYFGVMPHHPTIGSPVFRYNPKSDRLTHFGEFDALAKAKGPGLIPCMLHAPPVEMNGRLYWTGQDPFYGDHGFPGMTRENTRFAGSPLLMYDMKTEKWTPLGIPIPSDHPGLARPGPGRRMMGWQSVFHMFGDARHGDLYMRPGYDTGDWWVAKVGPDGHLTTEPKKAAFKGWTASLHLAEDGMIYYPLRGEEVGEDNRAGPKCDIWRFNPDTQTNEKIASFDGSEVSGLPPPRRRRGGFTSRARWVTGSHVPGQILGMLPSYRTIFRFDIKTGTATRLVRRPYGYGSLAVHNGKAYFFQRDQHTYPFPTTRLHVLDAATGKSKNLGTVVDDRGRWIFQVTDTCVSHDGKMIISAEVWGLPGENYGRRYRYVRPGRVNSCLWVIDDVAALAAGGDAESRSRNPQR